MDHSRLQSQSSPSVDSSQGLIQVSPTADDRTRDKRYHLDSQQSSTTLMRENTSHKIQDLVANSGKFGKLGFDCSICEQEFDDLESLDAHMILHTSTRSGRSIKHKKFFEDVVKDPVIKRQRRRIAGVCAGRRKCAKVSTKCQDCGLVLDNHQDLFRHFLSHLDPNIVKTLPVYESGDTGYCPFCCEPLLVDQAEDHMEEKHSDLLERKEGSGVEESDLEERSVIQVPEEVEESNCDFGKC